MRGNKIQVNQRIYVKDFIGDADKMAGGHFSGSTSYNLIFYFLKENTMHSITGKAITTGHRPSPNTDAAASAKAVIVEPDSSTSPSPAKRTCYLSIPMDQEAYAPRRTVENIPTAAKFINQTGDVFTPQLCQQQMIKPKCERCNTWSMANYPICMLNRHHVVCGPCSENMLLDPELTECPSCRQPNTKINLETYKMRIKDYIDELNKTDFQCNICKDMVKFLTIDEHRHGSYPSAPPFSYNPMFPPKKYSMETRERIADTLARQLVPIVKEEWPNFFNMLGYKWGDIDHMAGYLTDSSLKMPNPEGVRVSISDAHFAKVSRLLFSMVYRSHYINDFYPPITLKRLKEALIKMGYAPEAELLICEELS